MAEADQQLTAYPAWRVFSRFIDVLRKNDFSITPHDRAQALKALEITGTDRQDVARSALCATLARSPEEVQVFHQLFDLYFAAGSVEGLPDINDEFAQELRFDLVQEEDLRKLIDKNPLLQDLKNQNHAALRMRMLEAARSINLDRIQNFMQSGYFTFQMMEQLGIYRLQALVRSAGGGGTALDRALDDMRDAVGRFVQDKLDQQDVQMRSRFRRNSTLDQPLLNITPEYKAKIERELERMVQTLKTRVSRRRTKQKRGQINLHKTIRSNLIHGGTPFHLAFKNKRENKPELILLLDMSESVRNASEFLLLFVYSLQELFRKVRTFIFSGSLVEISDLLRDSSLEEAVQDIFKGGPLNIWEPSNFGRSFDQFATDYPDAITPKSTLLILGDARNNYNPARAELVQDFQEKARKTWWLNPEPRSAWGFGDSVMPEYEPYVDEAVEIKNLRQLNTFVNRLVLK